MKLIGLAGPSGSGKDAAAQVIRGEGWLKIAYADALREFLQAVDPIVGHLSAGTPLKLNDVIETYGWQGYKETRWAPEVRRLIQRTGTEAGRGIIGENVWIDAMFKKMDIYGRHVVSDVRFPNEAQAIWDRGGKVFWISRPGIPPINDHISERALTAVDCDDIITNDDSHEVLRQRMMRAILVNQNT